MVVYLLVCMREREKEREGKKEREREALAGRESELPAIPKYPLAHVL